MNSLKSMYEIPSSSRIGCLAVNIGNIRDLGGVVSMIYSFCLIINIVFMAFLNLL